MLLANPVRNVLHRKWRHSLECLLRAEEISMSRKKFLMQNKSNRKSARNSHRTLEARSLSPTSKLDFYMLHRSLKTRSTYRLDFTFYPIDLHSSQTTFYNLDFTFYARTLTGLSNNVLHLWINSVHTQCAALLLRVGIVVDFDYPVRSFSHKSWYWCWLWLPLRLIACASLIRLYRAWHR